MTDNVGIQIIVDIDGEELQRLDGQLQCLGAGQHLLRAGGVIIGKRVCVGCGQGAVLRGRKRHKRRCGRPCGSIGHRQARRRTEGTGHKPGHPVGTKVVCVGVIAGVEPPFGGFQSLLSDQLHGVGVQVQHGDSFFFP